MFLILSHNLAVARGPKTLFYLQDRQIRYIITLTKIGALVLKNSLNNIGVGARCAAWLRELYPNNKGKLVARDFNVSENTAWRWMSGVAPTVLHLEEMVSRWGHPFLNYVFDNPESNPREQIEKIIAIKAELDRRDAENKLKVPTPSQNSGEIFSRARRMSSSILKDLQPSDQLANHDYETLSASLRYFLTELVENSPPPRLADRAATFFKGVFGGF